jgi:hypothetical protein
VAEQDRGASTHLEPRQLGVGDREERARERRAPGVDDVDVLPSRGGAADQHVALDAVLEEARVHVPGRAGRAQRRPRPRHGALRLVDERLPHGVEGSWDR